MQAKSSFIDNYVDGGGNFDSEFFCKYERTYKEDVDEEEDTWVSWQKFCDEEGDYIFTPTCLDNSNLTAIVCLSYPSPPHVRWTGLSCCRVRSILSLFLFGCLVINNDEWVDARRRRGAWAMGWGFTATI